MHVLSFCVVPEQCHDGDLRTVGDNVFEGRLEICIKQEWGTICDDGWGNQDAMVACSRLGASRWGRCLLMNA